MSKEVILSNRNGIKKLFSYYEKVLTQKGKLEDIDLIDRFFNPLRAEINQGRYDYEIVKVWSSATNLLDLKIQTLLDRTLQKESLKEQKPSDSEKEFLSTLIHLSKPIQPIARPLSKADVTKAYVELMIHRKRKHIYSSEPERMSYDPVEIERISIELDKNKLFQKIQTFKKSSIDLLELLEKKTWQEVICILNILLHLAHEKKIELHQVNFPEGKIIINYVGGEK